MKKFLIPLLILVLLLPGCAGKAESTTYRQISMEEAMQIMAENTDYLILDVRTREEFDTGHIPGAICIPNESISADVLQQLPNPDQLLLVYCRSGNRSKQAAGKLAALGYTNIVEFGGITSWTGETVSGAE